MIKQAKTVLATTAFLMVASQAAIAGPNLGGIKIENEQTDSMGGLKI